MYETAQLVSWLRDKAARAEDPSWQRMMNLCADRMEELSRSQRWLSPDVPPPTEHNEYPDIDEVIEWDASEPVLVVTTSGDVTLARYVFEEGRAYWYDANEGEELEVERWQPDPRETAKKEGGCHETC